MLGIVAVHRCAGWREFYQEFSGRLARDGYSALCPDPHCPIRKVSRT
jgi:dienelactone hydrolase